MEKIFDNYELLEQTVLGGFTYILVADDEDNAMILKDVSAAEEEEACYVEVTDEKEQSAVAGIFAELLEDIEIE